MYIRSAILATVAIAAFALPLKAQTPTPPMPAAPTAPTQSAPAPTITAPANPAIGATPALGTNATVGKGGMFYTETLTPTHWRSSEAIGLAVYNRSNEKIGDVEDVIIDTSGRVAAIVIGVGGFLGIGERKVAVSYPSFQMSREANSKARLVVDLDKTILNNAPEYKAMVPSRS